MEFYDARDASGERLWYAVAGNFANFNAATVINSNDRNGGSISLFDQSGNLLYDGSVNGIAAVIIAPGAVVNRDADGNASYETPQDRINFPDDPAQYLDTFDGAFDNSRFVNGSAADGDGFILGPIFDTAEGDIVVNDQMIIITADEIIDMAEKKVLETYRDAIRKYLSFTGNKYPWLYNYAAVTDAADARNFFPVTSSFTASEQPTYLNPGNFGRIPSIFSNYFTDTDSQAIETELSGYLKISYPLDPAPVTSTIGNQIFNPSTIDFKLDITDKLTGVRFDALGDRTDGDGLLMGTLATSPLNLVQKFYFWDNDAYPGAETGKWTICPDDGDNVPELSDCHRDGSENPTPGGANLNKEEILIVTLTFQLANPFNFYIDFDTPPSVVLDSAADGSKHATLTATIAGANLASYPATLVSADIDIDRHYHESESFSAAESGSLTLADLSLSSVSLTMRYYPELPYWVVDNQWHDSVRMAYASNYLPPLTGPCSAGVNCLEIQNTGNPANNKTALLVIAGQHDWVNDSGPDLEDDLGDVFDTGNDDLDTIFDARAPGGNDKLLVIGDI